MHAGPKETLDSTAVSQPAIYVASLAALEKLKQDSPDVVAGCNVAAGLSLGEYTALAFAGALSFEDGLKLVRPPAANAARNACSCQPLVCQDSSLGMRGTPATAALHRAALLAAVLF